MLQYAYGRNQIPKQGKWDYSERFLVLITSVAAVSVVVFGNKANID